MKDPDFIGDLKKLRLPLSPKSAVEALKTVEAIYASSPEVVAAAKTIINE